jgi:hypothetical protein
MCYWVKPALGTRQWQRGKNGGVRTDVFILFFSDAAAVKIHLPSVRPFRAVFIRG